MFANVIKDLSFYLYLAIHSHTGIATNFAPVGDPWNPDPHAACLHRDLTDKDLVVANNWLPCNSSVLIYNVRNGKSVVAKVGDRGPRHADLDLSPAVTKKLHANGMEKVVFIPMWKGLK